ncbi:MAG: response regulator [Desulfuromonadales bacterium]
MESINSQISVMIVDDEELFVCSLLVNLEDMGFRSSGYLVSEEALQAVQDNPPDVCIMDLRMPGMNGEELVKEIHKVAPTVRCMILTGSFYKISDELELLGMTQEYVIQKPINDYPEFFRKISSLALP